ncbi:hypothetical protein PL10110_330089 [Planktothrix agardhii]|nr:hypothetical protein [Planktothrix agardhii]CAD0227488.1 hypothetical protein PL10110_330089 [Planktothrix agardhii]
MQEFLHQQLGELGKTAINDRPTLTTPTMFFCGIAGEFARSG